MQKIVRTLAVGVVAIALAGCATTIPAKLEVRDTASGRTYQTYKENAWGQVTKGTGYEFNDIDTGNRITLTNYEIKTVEGQKSVPGDSADAKAFAEQKARAGIK
jgi:hypothetical protein